MNHDINQANCPVVRNSSPDDPPGFHRCPRCGVLVSDERSELLGVDECINCAPQKQPPVGVWDYPEGFHERNEGVGGLIILN